jgi:6-phosphogluconate dehydrogenase
MPDYQFDIGVIGAGTMGANLALNIADHGFSVAVYDADADRIREFSRKYETTGKIIAAGTLPELAGLLRRPRAVIALVPAGKPVDDVIESLVPCFEKGDLIIDGGNSHFRDTERRAAFVAEQSMLFMGMGISGGESGARHGPSLMPGGAVEAYERVRPVLEKIAAHVNGDPCVAYLGAGSAGHYVKMVHNGIEYALMQLISETYDIMRRGLKMKADMLADLYSKWNEGALNSYLLEITAGIFRFRDPRDPKHALIDMVLDKASQHGTGKWTSREAMDRGVPTPNIDAALIMRNLSDRLAERAKASMTLPGPDHGLRSNAEWLIKQLPDAYYAGMVMCYAQGMELLAEASREYGYGLDLELTARIWRGGCIIRAALLDDIREAFGRQPGLTNLLLDKHLGIEVAKRQNSLRAVVGAAAELGLPAPGFSASLAYFDAYRSALLPVNLIQAQRDYFGAHTYERRDMPGKVFHTEWSEM